MKRAIDTACATGPGRWKVDETDIIRGATTYLMYLNALGAIGNAIANEVLKTEPTKTEE